MLCVIFVLCSVAVEHKMKVKLKIEDFLLHVCWIFTVCNISSGCCKVCSLKEELTLLFESWEQDFLSVDKLTFDIIQSEKKSGLYT